MAKIKNRIVSNFVLHEKVLACVRPQIQLFVTGFGAGASLQRVDNICNPNIGFDNICDSSAELVKIDQFWRPSSKNPNHIRKILVDFIPGDTPENRNYLRKELQLLDKNDPNVLFGFIYVIPCPFCMKGDLLNAKSFLHNIIPFMDNIVVVLDHNVDIKGEETKIIMAIALGQISELNNLDCTPGCPILLLKKEDIDLIVTNLDLEDFNIVPLNITKKKKFGRNTFVPNMISKYGFNVEYLLNCLKEQLIR
jgi:hypothetical protein